MANKTTTLSSFHNRLTLAVTIVLLATPSLTMAQTAPGLVEGPADPSTFELRYTATYSRDQLIFGELLGYDTVEIQEALALNEPGVPMLPVVQVKIALPADMAVTGARALDVTSVPLPGHYTIFPTQPPRRTRDPNQGLDFVEPDPEIYESPEIYPAEVVRRVRQIDLAGQNMAVLQICPVRWSPLQKRLTLHTSITVLIEGTDGHVCASHLSPAISAAGLQSYERMLTGMVVNPEDVELRPALGSPQPRLLPSGQYDYVIIAPADWTSAYQPLADWKTKKGVPAKIVTLSDITSWYGDSTKVEIRDFIGDAYDTWGAIYFLLGSDTNYIPYHTRSILGDSIPSDTYYACLDSTTSDWVCDVHVGRCPARTTTHAANFVNKVITYESNPPLTSYARTVFLMGFDLYTYGSGEGANCKSDIDSLYIPSGWTVRTEYDSEGGGHEADCKSYLNQGNNLVNHIDHGDTDVVGVGATNHGSYLSTSELKSRANGDRQSIMYSIGCWTCNYPNSECAGEGFVKGTAGGGVAYVGNSRYGWYTVYNDNGVSLRFDRFFFRSLFNQNHYILGECFSDHKNDAYFGDSYMKYIFTELTLLGDPELNIWTENPEALEATHAATLNVNEYTTFPVEVYSGGSPVNQATVCLWKDGDVYEVKQTDAAGAVTFEFTAGTTGTMYVTARKRNYLPEESSAEVVEGTTYYTLTINANGQGSVDLSPPGGTYESGTPVELTATADVGWHFDHWEGDLSGSTNPDTVVMDGDKTVTATFAADCYGDLNGDGSVNISDLAMLLSNYGITGSATYQQGDLNGDGDVNLSDLADLLSVYGTACW